MVDTIESSAPAAPEIYDEIGVRPIINGRGATTAVGGTLMVPEVLVAMAEAAGRVRRPRRTEYDGLASGSLQ